MDDRKPIGNFEIPDPRPAQMAELERQMIEEQERESIAEQLAYGDMGDSYQRPQAPDGQAQIIKQVNALEPFKYNKEHKIISGDVPEDMLFDFWGFLAPTNSLSNIDERAYEVGMSDFQICRLARRFARPRESYTPQRNVDEDNAEHMFRAKSRQSIGGFERIMSATQRTEVEQGYNIQKTPSRLQATWERMKGKDI